MKPGSLMITLAGLLLAACDGTATSPKAESIETVTAEHEGHAPRIITPGQRRTVPYVGHDVSVLVEMKDTQAGIALQEEILKPRTMGAPPHIHQDEDEYFIVLEGSVSFLTGEDTVVAGPGTVAILPRGHWHGFWNLTDEPVRMILAMAPGNFGSFFDEVVMTIRAENAETPDAIGGIVAKVAASRNVTVDMSRLPPEVTALLAPPTQE